MRSRSSTRSEPSLDADTISAALGSTTDIETIRFDQVTKRYGDVVALRAATLRFDTGACHLLAGPNGSGKSTAGKLAVGLSQPSSGTISGPTADVGFCFQSPRYYPSLTVAENLAVFARATGVAPEDPWIGSLVAALRLDEVDGQSATTLSGGFKKKLDLAISLLDTPQYLWLDEPLSDLDGAAVDQVRSLLERYVDAGGGVVVSTHNLAAFSHMTTELTVLVDGVPTDTVAIDQRDRSLEDAYQAAIASRDTQPD